MSNITITNKQGSILSLAPLLDELGAVLVLQPKGSKGNSKTISAETAEHEIIERVKKAGWVSLAPVGMSAPEPEPAPASEPVPAPAPPSASAPAPTTEMPKETIDTLVEETKAEVPTESATSSETPVEPTSRTFPSEPPSKGKRR